MFYIALMNTFFVVYMRSPKAKVIMEYFASACKFIKCVCLDPSNGIIGADRGVFTGYTHTSMYTIIHTSTIDVLTTIYE
jgi:hypothetical protein